MKGALFFLNKKYFYLILFLVIFLFLLAASPKNIIKEAKAQSCEGGWFPSFGQCCQCDHGNASGQYGPVTCCNPPGGTGQNCNSYSVNGCAPEPDDEPDPTPTSAPPQPTPVPQPDPVPPPYVPCNQTRSPEFHSLRPYQASPCNQSYDDLALFCGNDLTLSDSITVNRSQATSCADNCMSECLGQGNSAAECADVCSYTSGSMVYCNFSIDRTKEIAIDLSGAELPIAGNTEDVVNSQDQPNPEPVDDAGKVNEYISWYLNGVTKRAEYNRPNPNTEEGISLIVDYSGPIKKLLPDDVQENERFDEVDSAGDDRHNQIIGCVNLLGIPTHCYPPRAGVTRRRLTGWTRRLYEHIPFSSTEDRKGRVETESVTVQPASENMTITNVSFTNQQPAELFFAHMQENSELADILQGSYVPDDVARTGPVSDVSPAPYCDLTRIRSNPGDNLFAGEIRGDLNYTANFSCAFAQPNACSQAGGECYSAPSCLAVGQPSVNGGSGCSSPSEICCAATNSCIAAGGACYSTPSCSRIGQQTVNGGNGCNAGAGEICCSTVQECTVTANVRLSLITQSPLVDDIWSRLVAGPSGTFKRFFPQVGSGAPIEGIVDIPAATGVVYRSLDGTPVHAGNPGTGRSGSQAELYFPHLGGVHEYFLKCIQQALRPDGFGEGCLSGAPGTQSPTVSCDEDIPDSALPQLYQDLKPHFLQQSINWLPQGSACYGLDNNLADECYNHVVMSSLDAGVNPAFTLTIWLNETDASNYCHSGPTAQDFGINDSSIYQNYGEQLERFLGLPTSGTYTYCRDNPASGSWSEPMHAFLSRFRAGGCDPSNSDGNTYYNHIRTFTWPLVTEPFGGCVSGNNFSISWPTDNSCP